MDKVEVESGIGLRGLVNLCQEPVSSTDLGWCLLSLESSWVE